MKYYYLEPEVAGGLGPDTVMQQGSPRPAVKVLHYVFDGWLGDEILESTPCFIVTERLAQAFKDKTLTGFNTDAVQVGRSETFEELYPNRELPKFVWLQVCGEHGVDDFFIADDGRLVVSERARDAIMPLAENSITSDYP